MYIFSPDVFIRVICTTLSEELTHKVEISGPALDCVGFSPAALSLPQKIQNRSPKSPPPFPLTQSKYRPYIP